MKQLHLCLLLAGSMLSMSAFAAHTPTMNEEYVVDDFQFPAWNKSQISGDCFLSGATKAIVKVYNAHYIEFYTSTDPCGNNAQPLAKLPYNNNVFTFTYTVEGAENIEAALKGYYWVHTDGGSELILSITNCDANYITPAPGSGDGGGSGSGGDINPPGYEPDYTGQNDADDNGVLEPDDINPAFGAKVDYKKFPQLTDVPSMYITVYKTTATPDGEGGYTYEYDVNQTEDISTTKNDWYYQCRIVIADKYGNMKQRDELVGLRGRGNSTWTWVKSGKRPLRLKFPSKTKLLVEQDAQHNEVNNFADAKSWTLMANAFDKTLIHNAFTYELGKGKLTNLPFCPAYRFVDLFVNNVYFGTYQVSDQVQVDKKRVNVNSQTGWFLELTGAGNGNAFLEDPYINVNNGSLYANVKNPEDATSGTPAFQAMTDYLSLLYNKLQSQYVHDFSMKTGYRTLVDVPSLIDWLIGEEISANFDGTYGNVYAYREAENDKLHFGPMWDLDIAYGAHEGATMSKIHVWENNGHFAGMNTLLATLYTDPYFVRDLYERWQAIYNGGELLDFCKQKIEMLAKLVSQTQAKNFTEAHPFNVSSTLGINEADNMGGSFASYDVAIAYFKQYVSDRIDWLNTEYSTQYSTMGCATLNPCLEGHTPGYLLQEDGTYLRGCEICGELDEPDTQTYYQFTIYPESKIAETIMATSWHPADDHPNSIAYVDASQSIVEQIGGWNIVTAKKNAEGNRTCSDLRLADGHPYYTENKFIADHVTFTRTMTGEWATVIVPFAFNADASDDYAFYELRFTDPVITVAPVHGTVSANTPLIVHMLHDASSLELTNQNTEVSKASTSSGSAADGLQLTGTYTTSTLTAAEYFLWGGKFWLSSEFTSCDVKVVPFRACLTTADPGAGATTPQTPDIEDIVASILSGVNTYSVTDLVRAIARKMAYLPVSLGYGQANDAGAPDSIDSSAILAE